MTSLLVPHDPCSASTVRHALVQELQSLDLPRSAVDDAVLVLSELVGNAVRHGRPLTGGGIRVGWSVDGDGLRLEVSDGGPGLPDGGGIDGAAPGGGALPVPVVAEGGRGLPIVDLLSSRWGTASGPAGGSAVYAEVPLPADAVGHAV